VHARREFKLRGFDTRAASDAMFDKDGEQISVAQCAPPHSWGLWGGGPRTIGTAHRHAAAPVRRYFAQLYPNFPVRRPDLPCVMVGKATSPESILIPMELCEFVSCQPAPVTADVQQEQIKMTGEPPQGRFAKIKDIMRDLVQDVERNDEAQTITKVRPYHRARAFQRSHRTPHLSPQCARSDGHVFDAWSPSSRRASGMSSSTRAAS
jgi:hypothetical protein